MAGPMIGGSAANERSNNKVTDIFFVFTITAATPTPSAWAVAPPTMSGEAALCMADGAGVIVTAATFDVTVTSTIPKLGLEFKDTTVTASAELIGVFGQVTATTGANNAELGTPVWAGPADLLKASAGVGLALYFHLGITGIGNAGKIDQNAGSLTIALHVAYIVD